MSIGKIRLMLGQGQTHKNVGRIFNSVYFGRPIVVTAFVDDTHWKFRFYLEDYTRTYFAGSPLSHFIDSGAERNDLRWDHMNEIERDEK